MAYLQSRRGKSVVFDRVEITEDTTARDCPSLRKECDHATVEIFVQMEGALVVVKGIGEQRECELDRAVTRCEARRRMFAKIEALACALSGGHLTTPAPPNRSAQPKQCSYSVLSLRWIRVCRVCRPRGFLVGPSNAITSLSREWRERRTCRALLRCPPRPRVRSRPPRRLRGSAGRTWCRAGCSP